MQIYQFPCGDTLHRYKKSLVLHFSGTRLVLSTGLNHGGCRSDLSAVFNNDGNPGPGMEFRLRAKTYREHLDVIAKEDLGLDPKTCTGFCTAASMDNVSIQTRKHDFFTVTAIVTGGIHGNGGRIGDPASYSEKPGTINIILHIDASLPKGTLVKALVSCTEAKTAAIQELLAPSRYSSGLATGSGTDGVILVCNPDSPNRLTDAGQHSALGELIGTTVKTAVKEALFRQTGLSPLYQHNIIHRMDRYGVTEDTLWKLYEKKYGAKVPRFLFEDRLDRIKTDDTLVTYTSLFAHLLDQLDWKLLKPEEVWQAGGELLKLAGLEPYAAHTAALKTPKQQSEEPDPLLKQQPGRSSGEAFISQMVQRYMEGLLVRLEENSLEENSKGDPFEYEIRHEPATD